MAFGSAGGHIPVSLVLVGLLLGILLAGLGPLGQPISAISSTAEGVALMRFLLSESGLLNEGISRIFFPGKATLFILFPSLRNGFLANAPGAASHLATRTWFYDENFFSLLKPGMQVVICGAGLDTVRDSSFISLKSFWLCSHQASFRCAY